MTRKYLFLIISILMLVEVSSFQWPHGKKSSACVGAKTLGCTKHKLTCPRNQQIKIKSAFYGFVKSIYGCPINRNVCTSQKRCACEWYRGDCGIPYTTLDEAEVMRCSGQRSCNPSSSISTDNSRCGHVWRARKYNSKNSYTEIDYDCIKAQRTDTNEPNVIEGKQVVLDGSKDEVCTYTVDSWMKSVIFYQTNRKQETFILHGHLTQSGVYYHVMGRFKFTIHPNTDTFILLTGGIWHPTDVKVRYECHGTANPSTSTRRAFSFKSTTTVKTTYQRPNPTIKPYTAKHVTPTSTSLRPRPKIRTTAQIFNMETKTTSKALVMETRTAAFDMEEVTRNEEDEIIQQETNDRARPQASLAKLRGGMGGLIGGLIGGSVALIIILFIVFLLFYKRLRGKTEKPVVVQEGINNPGYEVSYINPKIRGPPPAYKEIDHTNDKSGTPPGPPAGDYNHINDVMNNHKNDVKDTEFQFLAGDGTVVIGQGVDGSVNESKTRRPKE